MAALKQILRKLLAKNIPWLFSDMKIALAICLQRLGELNQVMFNCYLTKDYLQKQYLYEKSFHEHRRNFLYVMNKFRKNKNYADVTHWLENLYEIILALNLLLYRVTDHSTFEVASKEFYAIADSITRMFRDLADFLVGQKEFPSLPFSLAEHILQLEEVNQVALRLVTIDPMIFEIFIQDLRALNETLTELSLDMLTLDADTRK